MWRFWLITFYIWLKGLLAVGLFASHDSLENTTMGRSGVFHGGGFYLLGIQLLAVVVIAVWSSVLSLVILLVCKSMSAQIMFLIHFQWLSNCLSFFKILKFTVGLRLSVEDELMGADYSEHMIGQDTMVTQILKDYVKESRETRRETPLSVISGKADEDNAKNNEKNCMKEQNSRVTIRRGSCISRLSYQISRNLLIKHEKVAPLNNNSGEIPGQTDESC